MVSMKQNRLFNLALELSLVSVLLTRYVGSTEHVSNTQGEAEYRSWHSSAYTDRVMDATQLQGYLLYIYQIQKYVHSVSVAFVLCMCILKKC